MLPISASPSDSKFTMNTPTVERRYRSALVCARQNSRMGTERPMRYSAQYAACVVAQAKVLYHSEVSNEATMVL